MAYTFDGTGDWLTTTGSCDGLGNFSVSLWYKTTSTAIVVPFGGNTGGSNTMVINLNMDYTVLNVEDTVWFYVINGSGAPANTDSSVTLPSTQNDGNWHHLLVTHTWGTTPVQTFYFDGVSRGTPTYRKRNAQDGQFSTFTDQPAVGARNNGGSFISPMNGDVAEVAVYNGILTAKDALQLFKYSPLLVQPSYLNWYMPLHGLQELVQGTNAAVVGDAAPSSHPPIIQPSNNILQVVNRGKIWVNDAATKDGGEVLQTHPGAGGWTDSAITVPQIIDTTGLTGQLYLGVENAAGEIDWHAITVEATAKIGIGTFAKVLSATQVGTGFTPQLVTGTGAFAKTLSVTQVGSNDPAGKPILPPQPEPTPIATGTGAFDISIAASQIGRGQVVDVETKKLIPVHLTYGAKDRVVASIFADNTQNKPIRLPAMSAYMNAIELSPDRRKGVGSIRRETFMPTGGQFPDDIKTIEQLMPVPYNARVELSIYTSNRDEHLQILEQIFMFFDPVLQVQKTDDTFDWTKITTVELTNINFEENYPAGTDRRIIQTTLQFVMPIYISVPAKLKNNFIADINLRVGLVSSGTRGSHNIIAELDDLDFDYGNLFSIDELDIDTSSTSTSSTSTSSTSTTPSTTSATTDTFFYEEQIRDYILQFMAIFANLKVQIESNTPVEVTPPSTFFYDEQIRNYILQFMAVFAGTKVQIGKLDDRESALIPVHLTYGAKDRVVASIFSDNTQNKPIRLPAMSAYMNAIELSPDRRKGVNTTRRETFMPTGGLFPHDIKTIEQLMPVPYNSTMELSIYTSNRDEHLQILEQIFMFFDPVLQVQKTDDTFDWTKITTVELVGINFEENYPAGTDRRIIQTTLQFLVPIYIAVPAKIKNNFIADINLRVGLVSAATSGSHNIIAELDDLEFDYGSLFTLDDLVLPE